MLTLFGLLSGFAEVSKSKAAGPAGGLVFLCIQKKCRLFVDCAWVCLPTALQLERLVNILRTPFESPWSKETCNSFFWFCICGYVNHDGLCPRATVPFVWL